jgi:hypothetical protein
MCQTCQTFLHHLPPPTAIATPLPDAPLTVTRRWKLYNYTCALATGGATITMVMTSVNTAA